MTDTHGQRPDARAARAEGYADGFIDGIHQAGATLTANTTRCRCDIVSGGARIPRPDCEVHRG